MLYYFKHQETMTDMDIDSNMKLDFISVLEVNNKVRQTGLSKRLCIAAGLVNILMKSVIKHSFIKMNQIPALNETRDHAVVICDARNPQACFDQLAKMIDHVAIYCPEAYYIKDQPANAIERAA